LILVKISEINSKNELLDILQNKANRIETKTAAMREYGDYLESVKQNNQDEYSEIGDILSRYNTLKQSNVKLEESKKNLENAFDEMKTDASEYEKKKKNEIMSLNNDVAKL
jgi:multidrug resistance efflux pump